MNYDIYRNIILVSAFPHLVEAMRRFEINTPLRCSHFLSQASHESAGFSKTTENLNYSSDGLKKIFPRYFTDAQALIYQRQPEMIASRVYASRMGNGDEQSREGWKFRGRGYFQLTGKNNYRLFQEAVHEDFLNNPDLVATPKFSALSAAWFFNSNRLELVADKGSSDAVVMEMTKKINGGTHGYDDRLRKFKLFTEAR